MIDMSTPKLWSAVEDSQNTATTMDTFLDVIAPIIARLLREHPDVIEAAPESDAACHLEGG